MAAFLIATVVIIDDEKMKAYHKHVAGVMQRYGGEAVASGPVIECLEGSIAPGERATVLKFPDIASAKDYIASPEYQAGKKARGDGVIMTMRLLEF